MVAKEIRDMNDNKLHGVDGIPPKSLVEIVEQISIPLEWKEANIIPLCKKVRKTSEYTIDDLQTIRKTN